MAKAKDLYQQIIAEAAADDRAEIKYELAPCEQGSLKMVNHPFPYSIAPVEFDFMGRFIRRHHLTRGYECATAFGISTLCAALAFKETGGKLATIDAYIEEKRDTPDYRGEIDVKREAPDGLKSLDWLTGHFGVSETVEAHIGWSPYDVPAAIRKTFGEGARLDFAFLDAGHWDESLMRDAAAICPYIDPAQPFAIFIHDCVCFTEKSWSMCNTLFQRETLNLTGLLAGPSWNLACITNLPLM